MKNFLMMCLLLLGIPALAEDAAIKTADGAAERTVLAVSTVQAQTIEHERTLPAEGEVAAREMAMVNAQVAGVALQALHVHVGDKVEAGQVLAEFDSALIRHERAQAEAATARAQAALKLAKTNAARARKLAKDRAMSQLDVDQMLSAEQDARAALDGAKAARDMADLRLDYAQVRAPVAGVVVSRPAEVGMTAAVGLPLFTLMVDGALEWRAQVSPEAAADLRVGMPAQLMAGTAQIRGKITRIAPTADVRSRRVTVYVALPADSALRAGMFVRGAFLLGKESVQVIPATVIVREDGYDYVMLVAEDGRVRRQVLMLGERLGERVVVREGLPPDARMVARGASFLQDGNKVKVVAQ